MTSWIYVTCVVAIIANNIIPTHALAESERDNLISIFRSTNIVGPNNEPLWSTNTDPCSWHGITCADSAGNLMNETCIWDPITCSHEIYHVTQLNWDCYEECQANGTFPDIGFSSLGWLRALSLSSLSNLTGSLPPLTSQPNLDSIEVLWTNLSGNFPAINARNDNGLTTPSAKKIRIQYNHFDGFSDASLIPGNAAGFDDINYSSNARVMRPVSAARFFASLPDSIKQLSCSGCGLTGPIPHLSREFLSSLEYVFLGYNEITDGFDNFIQPYSTSLRMLSFTHNQLRLNTPDTSPYVIQSDSLSFLDISFNHIEIGPIISGTLLTSLNVIGNPFQTPPNMTSLTEISDIELSHARFTTIDINQIFSYLPLDHKLSQFRCVNCSLHGKLSQQSALMINQSTIRSIDVRNNELSGNVGTWLPDDTQIRTMWLSNNKFSDPITRPIIAPRLRTLYIDNNDIDGSVPVIIGTEFSIMNISTNRFTGSTPDLSSHSNFQYLLAGHNQLDTIHPTPLPKNARGLFLDHNQLTSLPKWMYDAATLPLFIRIDVSHNHISSVIPDFCSVDAPPKLQYLDLSHNALYGTIPSLSACQNLVEYNISNNQITGSLPAEIPQTLVKFNVANNQLSGQLPPWFTQQLKELNITCNAFSSTGAVSVAQSLNLTSDATNIWETCYNATEFVQSSQGRTLYNRCTQVCPQDAEIFTINTENVDISFAAITPSTSWLLLFGLMLAAFVGHICVA